MQFRQICAAAPTGGIHALVAYNRETMSRNPISDQSAPRLLALFNTSLKSHKVISDILDFININRGVFIENPIYIEIKITSNIILQLRENPLLDLAFAF